jgi:uncharacterized protein (TIGR02217 family)
MTQYNFINLRFPEDIAYGSSGGPEFNTEILTTNKGSEYRNNKWHYPKLRFDVALGVKNKKQMEELISFFRICQGRHKAFLYKDWSDYVVKNTQGHLLSAGKLQLIKEYKLDLQNVATRNIKHPIISSLKLEYNNQQLNSDQFILEKGGIIQIIDPTIKAEKVFCNFEFDIQARFDLDYLPVTIENYKFFSLPEIPIIEVIDK